MKIYTNKLSKGTLYSEIYTYRTKDGSAYFKFSYHQTSDGIEIDIHSQPDYGSRNGGSVIAHWLTSPREAGRKICFQAGMKPKTFSDAQKISMQFAEVTNTYIKTGVTIDTQIQMRNN